MLLVFWPALTLEELEKLCKNPQILQMKCTWLTVTKVHGLWFDVIVSFSYEIFSRDAELIEEKE